VVLWASAAASADALGMWRALGGTAVGLGLFVVVLDAGAVRALLRPTRAAVVAGAVAAAAMVAATYGLYSLVSRVAPALARDTAQLYARFDAGPHAWRAILLVPIVVGEEIVWRGLVQGALARRLGAGPTVVVAALIYAAVHAPVGSSVLVLAALGCGLVWGGLRANTAGLAAPIIAHLVWDEVLMFVAPVVR
jgi:membrane protease YdiL (CAAX protease family)